MKKSKLGRGLDALLTDSRGDVAAVGETLRQLPIETLRRGKYQPRVQMDQDALDELANSIKTQGIMQPILVRETASGEFEIIAGERRWRAAQLAGLDTVPALVRDITDQAAMAMGLIENIQREDLNPMEQARGLQRLLDEFEMTHQQIAESIGRSRTAVTNLLRLLSLHAKVGGLLESGKLDMGHARALLALPEKQQPSAAQTVVRKDLSVRETERLVRQISKETSASKKSKPSDEAADTDIRRLEDDLSQKLGAVVKIAHQKNGSGKVAIGYSSLDELDGILERIH